MDTRIGIWAAFVVFLFIFISVFPVGSADDSITDVEIDPADWRHISLVLFDENSTVIMEVELLRLLTWTEESDAEVGGWVHLVLPEKGINDLFYVRDICPCPDIDNGVGNLVTGTFHSYGEVLNITLESGLSMECTLGHRFYSEDRGWIPAQELSIDERILAKDGFVTIASIESRPDVHEVFNLEVADDHTYCVTDDNVVSHNTNPCAKKSWQVFDRRLKGKDYTKLKPGELSIQTLQDLQRQTGLEHGVERLIYYGNTGRRRVGPRILFRGGERTTWNNRDLVRLAEKFARKGEAHVQLRGVIHTHPYELMPSMPHGDVGQLITNNQRGALLTEASGGGIVKYYYNGNVKVLRPSEQEAIMLQFLDGIDRYGISTTSPMPRLPIDAREFQEDVIGRWRLFRPVIHELSDF